MIRQKKILLAAAPLLLSGALAAMPAQAANYGNASSKAQSQMNNDNSAVTGRATTGTAANMNKNETAQKNDADKMMKNALKEVRTMQKNPQLKQLMAKAKGIYLEPDFGRGALVVGGRGGAGVVLAHVNGKWTDPVFFDFGSISFGAQAGASGGPVAFLLMSQQAVDKFKSSNKISLNAGAGFTIVNFSKNAQASWGKGDIIFWSNTEGAYAGATASVTDINYADGNNKAYYGKQIDPAKVLDGNAAAMAKPTSSSTQQLKSALPG
ncbi:MAG: lipid-binding SYLF domain-containing protein [Pseudolabrys sp.]